MATIMSHIQAMFNPKTIALIGAAEKRNTAGRRILRNLLQSKDRKVFPISPLKKKVLDLETYPRITSVPEHMDLAVVATPAPSVPEVVDECGQAGIEGALIISGGFKEVGEEGKQLESEIAAIRKNMGSGFWDQTAWALRDPPWA
jgi:acetyltransferase